MGLVAWWRGGVVATHVVAGGVVAAVSVLKFCKAVDNKKREEGG